MWHPVRQCSVTEQGPWFLFDFFDKGSDNSARSHGGETKGCEGRQAGSPNDPLLKKLKKVIFFLDIDPSI